MLYYLFELFYFYCLLLFSCVLGNIVGFYQRVSFFELAQLHVLPKLQQASQCSMQYATNFYNMYCKSYVDHTILPFFNGSTSKVQQPPQVFQKKSEVKEKVDLYENRILSPRNVQHVSK